MQGTIPQETLQQLKEQFDFPLYKWSTKDKKHDFIFTTLTYNNYHAILKHAEENESQYASPLEMRLDLEAETVKLCLIWPDPQYLDLDVLPVGIISSLSKVISEYSGFIGVDLTGNAYGSDVYSNLIKDYNYWPNITEEEIEKLKSIYTYPMYWVKTKGFNFVFRPLLREDVTVLRLQDNVEILRKVTLWPDEVDWDSLPIGTIDHLAKQVNNLSGWNVDNVTVEEL